MKKKLFFGMNLVLLLLVAVFFLSQHTAAQMFPRFSDKAIHKINKNFIVTDKDILEVLRYNGKELPFDAEKGIFYLPLSMDDPDWEQGAITSGTKGCEITFLSDVEAQSKEELMANGTEIPFLAVSGNTYRQYALVITGLPVIEITTTEAPAEEDGEGRYHIRVLSTDSAEGVVESDARMHVRGNTSRTYPKKGYRLQLVKQTASGGETANKQKLLGMRKDDDWILYAMYNDGTKIRDKLSIDIWNAYGADNNDFKGKLGTDLTYVEVVWDGAYYGIYGLMEPVDAKQVNLKKDNGLHLSEYIYKRKQPSDLSLSNFEEESDTAMRAGFELKGSRESISLADWEPLRALIAWQEQSSDRAFVRDAETYVNIENTVDFWIFANLITGYDQLAKNVYYIARAENNAYRFYFAPWDMDLTFGYTSDPDFPWGTKYESYLYENYIGWEPGNRLMKTDAAGARTLAQERYASLRETVLTDEWFARELENLQHTVVDSGAFERDRVRWPEGNHEGDYASLSAYTQKRLAWLDTFMSDIEAGLKNWE